MVRVYLCNFRKVTPGWSLGDRDLEQLVNDWSETFMVQIVEDMLLHACVFEQQIKALTSV